MDAGNEDQWLKGIKSSMLSQAAMSVCHLNSDIIKVNIQGNSVSLGLITVSTMMLILYLSNYKGEKRYM